MDVTTESFLLSLLVAYGLSPLAALLSRAHLPQQVTGLLVTLLALVTGFVQELIQNPHGYSWTAAGFHAALLWAVAWIAHNQTWADGKVGGQLYAKLLAFPRRLPPGGVQPGHEPAGMDAAA